MAELVPGVIGSVSGKVGTVIGAKWRDIYYLKGLPSAKKKQDTGNNINCIRLAKIYDFLSAVSPLAEDGFKHQNTGRASAFNLAMKANMRAFKGDSTDLDFASVVLSTGSLTGAIGPGISFESPDCLVVSWADLGDSYNQAPSDRASILFYNSDQDVPVISTGEVRRGDLKAGILIPGSSAGDHLHGYIYFTNAAGTKNSPGIYLGVFIVPAGEGNNVNTEK